MSIGNVVQVLDFTRPDLVLVLGENLDLGGNDNRNGVGKSGIINALSYALYGSSLTNIKKDNLINASNAKNMLVTLTFSINGVDYKIERGRKPNIFKFIKDGIEKDTGEDESQGEGRNTQEEIERIIGISHDMFKHIVALNTYVEPFLSLRANDQRIIIEQLLGITKLSEKADKLKEEAKIVKDSIKEEEFKISAATDSNKRIEKNIEDLEKKSIEWVNSHRNTIESIQESISNMLNVDIETELQLHKDLALINELKNEYNSLSKELKGINRDIASTESAITKINASLTGTHEKICPVCANIMDAETHKKVHTEYLNQLKDLTTKLDSYIKEKTSTAKLADTVLQNIPDIKIDTFYKKIEDAYNHKSTLDSLTTHLRIEQEKTNPYIDQIHSLKIHGIQEIDFTKLNELVKLRDHQECLLRLLTSKDSFIRKKIIDQNLVFLNHRLSHYLIDIGLPHTVKFKSDLEVEITLYGKEFDFDNLSRGERTRLILSLSWAFRDVYESMNGKINLLFIDELVDSGIDSSGVEASLAILKKMSRDSKRGIFLISHRDELIGRIDNIVKVVKENGFTTIEAI